MTREEMAQRLRQAAFPGAPAWDTCFADVQARWLRAADHALSYAEREVDGALKKAIATFHETGQHEAAKAIRKIRDGRAE